MYDEEMRLIVGEVLYDIQDCPYLSLEAQASASPALGSSLAELELAHTG